MIHKQEELEQLELEQALAMSLLAEEERLKQVRYEVKNSPDEDDEVVEQQYQSESKQNSLNVSTTDTVKFSDDSKDSKPQPAKAKLKPTTQQDNEHAYADPKPLKLAGFGSPLKALPAISKGQKQDVLSEMSKSFNEKKKKTEQAFSKNSRQLNDSRNKQVDACTRCNSSNMFIVN